MFIDMDDESQEMKEVLSLEFNLELFDGIFFEHIKEICIRNNNYPMNFQYLKDLCLRIKQMELKYNRVIERYNIIKESHCQRAEQEVIKKYPKKNMLFQVVMPLPLDLIADVESFIFEVKRCIESLFHFVMEILEPSTRYEYIHMEKIYTQIVAKEFRGKSIPAVLSDKLPSFCERYRNEWENWIRELVSIRTKLEHTLSLANSHMEIYAIHPEDGELHSGILVHAFEDDIKLFQYSSSVKQNLINFIKESLSEILSLKVQEEQATDKNVAEFFHKVEKRRISPQKDTLPARIYELEKLHDGFINDPKKNKKMEEKYKPVKTIDLIEDE